MTKKRKPYTLTPEDYMSREERKQLIKTCQERAELDLMKGRKAWPVRWMLVDLALFSGMRVAEMAALKIGDINLNSKTDPHLIVRNGKGNKKRAVWFDKELAKHLKQFISYKAKVLQQSIEPDAPLLDGRSGQHSTINTLQKSFKEAINAAGLRNKLSIHSARHTYATFLLKDSGNLRYVQQQLGHSNISMTSIYASILPEENGKLANMISRD